MRQGIATELRIPALNQKLVEAWTANKGEGRVAVKGQRMRREGGSGKASAGFLPPDLKHHRMNPIPSPSSLPPTLIPEEATREEAAAGHCGVECGRPVVPHTAAGLSNLRTGGGGGERRGKVR